jgi:hypothetical protein
VEEAQKGQVLILVILVMVVALTISLSVGARTIINTRTSTEEENSEQAFSAAEAGIEKSLNTGTGVLHGTFDYNTSYKTSYQTTVSDISGTSFLLNNGSPVLKDSAVDVWLSTYPNYTSQWSGSITIYWGQVSDTCQTIEKNNTMAALEIVVIEGSKAAPKMTHYALDPCNLRRTENNFESISSGVGSVQGKTFLYKKTININSGLIARIIPLYAPVTIGLIGSSLLPSQGTLVQSVGTANTTQRKIVSFRSYPQLPAELFAYTLFVPQ